MSVLDAEYEYLELELKVGVLSVFLNRPNQRNAVNGGLHRELAGLLSGLRTEVGIGAIVLAGAGKSFCAGGDARWFSQASERETQPMFTEARTIVHDLLDIGPPIIAAVHGHAVGFGATLALLCDVVIADDSASFGDPHVLMGVVAGDGGAAIWPALIGVNKAKQYLMTGDILDAAKAERMGLVNELVPHGTALDEAHKLAQRLSDGPRKAIEGTKRAVNEVLRMHLSAAFETSLALERSSMTSSEHREATTAFYEGRTPNFLAPPGNSLDSPD